MLLGYKEALKIEGYFYEYTYITKVKKTNKTKNFGCFRDNYKEIAIIFNKVYCRNIEAFNYLLSIWDNSDISNYSYIPIEQTEIKKFKVIDIYNNSITNKNNFKLVSFLEKHSIEYIQ